MFHEIIKLPNASNNGLDKALSYIGSITRVKFDGNCLKEDKITFTHGKTVNIYIVYEINCGATANIGIHYLFSDGKLVKNADIVNTCIVYIVLDFSFPTGRFGKNVVSFGADMSSSIHVSNKKKII